MARTESTKFKRNGRLNGRVVHEQPDEVLTISKHSREIFLEALLNPPQPNEKALAAAKRFTQEVH